MFYIPKTGCQWRMLPHDFPKWQLIYYYFRKWTEDGVFEEICEVLRDRNRQSEGKEISPSIGIIDSHSVKTTLVSGEERGIDGGKNINFAKVIKFEQLLLYSPLISDCCIVF
jgi:putative transposase